MSNSTPTRRWASLDEAGTYLGVSTKTVRRMISAGTIPAYRVGPRLVRIDLTEVDNIARPIATAGGNH